MSRESPPKILGVNKSVFIAISITVAIGSLLTCCCGIPMIIGAFLPPPPIPQQIDPQPVAVKPPPPQEKKPSVSVSAGQMMRDYNANEVNADLRYKDKFIEVTGPVMHVKRDIFNSPYVLISATSLNANTIFHVQCYLANENEAAIINPSTQIRLHGVGAGKVGNVVVKDCVIAK